MLGFAALLLFAPAQALAAAFGVSPPWIENEHIKPGTNFVYVINLSANNLAEDMMVDVKLNGDPEIMHPVFRERVCCRQRVGPEIALRGRELGHVGRRDHAFRGPGGRGQDQRGDGQSPDGSGERRSHR